MSQAPSAPSAASALDASRRRTLERLRVFIALAFALPLLALAVTAIVLYRAAFNEADEKLDTVTRIAQEHASKLLETNEMLLERMLDLLGDRPDGELLARAAEIHGRLRTMTADLRQVQGFFAIGADGRMLATNRAYPPPRDIDFSDREFLAAHRSGTGSRAFLTGRLVSRVTGEAFFDMSRRRTLADGSYAGTVNVALYPGYLTRFWEELAATFPGLRVALVRSDGQFVARAGGVHPGPALRPEHPLARGIASGAIAGTFASVASTDGAELVGAFRKLGDYPVYIATAIDRRSVLAGWASRVALLSGFAVPLALALAWMGWVALRRTRQEFEAVQRLEEETALRQRSEVALAHSQKLETVAQLAGGVAHDFNNLLMIISSNVHLLKVQKLHGPHGELAAMERAIAAGARLTRQLLALSGRQALAPERVVLQKRLPELLGLVRATLPATIALESHVEPDTAAIVADAAELELAFINLALNARDAIEGGGRLAVTARNAAADEASPLAGEHVVIEVADSGSGIEPAIAARVTEPFFTTKSPGKGTGLGLTQVQALCRGAGGTLRIESRRGEGTCVRMYFPRAPDIVAAQPEQAGGAVAARLECGLLLVEDNDAVAQATAAMLGAMGCRVERVEDARLALERLERRRYDVVLSDIEMPGLVDGIELALRLGRREPPVPVVLMSGYAARIEHARALGMPVLAKPCSAATLREALAEALASRPAGAEARAATVATPRFGSRA